MGKLIITIFLCMAPLLSKAEKVDPGDYDRSLFWMITCDKKDNDLAYVSCQSFVYGVMGTNLIVNIQLEEFRKTKGVKVLGCYPKEITMDGIKKIWVDYMKDNPDVLSESPFTTLGMAMNLQFPCEGK